MRYLWIMEHRRSKSIPPRAMFPSSSMQCDDRSGEYEGLKRVETIKRRLVCVGREDDLGADVPLVHSSINKTVLEHHDRITFYEALNKEIAFLVSCYDKAKAISLKAFFIDEAHVTCEWLIDAMENDVLLALRASEVNLEGLNVQRESINGIRDELYGLLLHPAFSSTNMTPTRILRLSDDVDDWTPWQAANFNVLMKEYSDRCDDDEFNESNVRHTTRDASIVFIYNKEREQHRKPVKECVKLNAVVKKYSVELKNDPIFVAYFEEKRVGAVAKTPTVAIDLVANTTTNARVEPYRNVHSSSYDDVFKKKGKKRKGENRPKSTKYIATMFGGNKDRRSSKIVNDDDDRSRLRRKSTSDLSNWSYQPSSPLPILPPPLVELAKETSSIDASTIDASSMPVTSVVEQHAATERKSTTATKQKKRRSMRVSGSLMHFLKMAECNDDVEALKSIDIVPQREDERKDDVPLETLEVLETFEPSETSEPSEPLEIDRIVPEPSRPLVVTSKTPKKRQKSRLSLRRLRSMSMPTKRDVDLPLTSIDEEKEEKTSTKRTTKPLKRKCSLKDTTQMHVDLLMYSGTNSASLPAIAPVTVTKTLTHRK